MSERFLFNIRNFFTVIQKPQSERFVAYKFAEFLVSSFKIQPINALERQKYHRIFSHMPVAECLLAADGESVEQRAVCADLEEVLQHTHIERLAETPRAGEKIHFAPAVQQIADKLGFIHIIESLCPDFFEIFNADRQFQVLHNAPPFRL